MVSLVFGGERQDIELDRTDGQSIAGFQPRFLKWLPIKERVGRPATNQDPLPAADDDAVNGTGPGRGEANAAVGGGTDGALLRAYADDPPIQGRAVDSEAEGAGRQAEQGIVRSRIGIEFNHESVIHVWMFRNRIWRSRHFAVRR